jgi:uncharacterized protein (DUF58 family)
MTGQAASRQPAPRDSPTPNARTAQSTVLSSLPPELLRAIRRIQVRANHLVTDVFLGEYHSIFRGRGIEFAEVREYQPGDDVRTIDWNVTARMGRPYVKQFVEERELTVLLLVDVSGSEGFSTGQRTKQEIAAEISALLALSAIKNNDKVGLIAFSDRIERFVPPKKGVRHVLRVVRELLSLQPRGVGTDIVQAVNFLNRVTIRRSIVFILSDFLAQGYERVLKVAAQRHEVIALVLTDPRELELPPVGLLYLEDAETGERLLVDSADPAVRRLFAKRAQEQQEERERLFRSVGVDMVDIRTDASYIEPLLRYFQMRARRGRTGARERRKRRAG